MTQRPKNDDRTKGRVGRPSKGPRRKLAFRATPELEAKLERAARDDRSLSEEVELRLERSFSEPDLVDDAVRKMSFGSRKVAKLFEMLGVIAKVASLRMGQDPDLDEDTFEAIRLAAVQYLSTTSAYMTPESQRVAADPKAVAAYAEEIADLARRVFHDRDRDKLKGELPLWARPDEGSA